jgi:membrane-bound serine protease (ClpP class)
MTKAATQAPRTAHRRWLALSLLASLATLAVVAFVGGALGQPESQPAGPVLRLRLDSIVHPMAADFLADALAEAEALHAAVVILELDTPGGLSSSMGEMTRAIQQATMPVVVYVSPSGARAASAGFFLLMAADVAAMAPGTNTGAAASIGLQGEDLPDTLQQKVEQDSRAGIRAMAERRGRNVELAELAITEAKAFSASEALEGGLIEIVANDFDDLLDQLEGREVVKVEGREPVRLALSGAPVEVVEMTAVQRFLAALIGPNVAMALLSFGALGLLIELYNPGSILPGVVGAICLILGAYGISMLPVNYAGLALMALALVLFIAEIKITSYGLLTVGGVISLVLGGLLLFRSSEPALRVSYGMLGSLAVFALVTAGGLAMLAVGAMRRQVSTGAEGLIHRHAEVRTALSPHGKVFVHGELWNAVSDVPVAVGGQVEVVAVDGLRLQVRPLPAERPASAPPSGSPS